VRGGGSIRVGSDDLGDIENRDAMGQIIQADVLNNARTVDLERPNSAVNTREEQRIEGQPRPCHKLGGTHGKGACFYGVSHASIPSGRGPSAPQFGVPFPSMYVAELPHFTW